MNNRTEFSDVKRRLQPGDVFHRGNHDWKTQTDRRWKGGCPWHESSSGTCFSVNPDTLEWHCFHCERGGGPLEYVAELENIGGARSSLKGQDFFRAWEALSRHSGCEGPPDFDSETASDNARDERRPLRNPKPRKETRTARKAESASTQSAGASSMSRDIPPRGQPERPTLDTPERDLRNALSRYRDTLKESDRARAYVEGRGLSVGTLYRHGCGFAPAGEWIGQDNAPRLVTPHTTAPGDSGRPKLVNLSGRYLRDCPAGKRHRHVGGNPTALFNASATREGSGPLVLCEGPLDVLSFIEAGHSRAVALHNTDGVPWTALRGNVETLVFAFDRDDTGRKDALERAIEARRRDFEAHVLHDEPAYEGHSDPNEAQQAGDLTLDYLRKLKSEGTAAGAGNPMKGADSGEFRAAPAAGSENKLMTDGENRGGPEPGQSPTTQATGGDGANEGHTAADLVPYWNGDDIGHLGRWLWERGGVPDGDVGGGLYADRTLHKWIAKKLQAGPEAADKQDRIRLRWVLWRLYAAHGPEEVPEWQIPIPPMRRA